MRKRKSRVVSAHQYTQDILTYVKMLCVYMCDRLFCVLKDSQFKVPVLNIQLHVEWTRDSTKQLRSQTHTSTHLVRNVRHDGRVEQHLDRRYAQALARELQHVLDDLEHAQPRLLFLLLLAVELGVELGHLHGELIDSLETHTPRYC